MTAATPSGSAPRNRPTALALSATITRSAPASSERRVRCAGSLSWNSSTMIVLNRPRSSANSSGFARK